MVGLFVQNPVDKRTGLCYNAVVEMANLPSFTLQSVEKRRIEAFPVRTKVFLLHGAFPGHPGTWVPAHSGAAAEFPSLSLPGGLPLAAGAGLYRPQKIFL